MCRIEYGMGLGQQKLWFAFEALHSFPDIVTDIYICYIPALFFFFCVSVCVCVCVCTCMHVCVFACFDYLISEV